VDGEEMKRSLIITVLSAVAAAVFAAPASAQAPSTLDGQVLLAFFGKCTESPPPPNAPCALNPAPPTVEKSCDPDGTSTLRYDLDNLMMIGPYFGPASEQGVVTIEPQDDPPVPTNPSAPFPALTGSGGLNAGPLASWTAQFRIVSGDTVVEGTKTLTGEAPGFGVCQDFEGEGTPFPGQEDLLGYYGIADATLSYTATITTPDGVYVDRGSAESDLRETFTTYTNRRADGTVTTDVGTDVGIMAEFFHSDLDAPQPVGKEFCKKGGWQDFPGLEFHNQGDCVSFFATGGKNEPGQNVP
jgi:hypothetical protein